MINAIIPRFIFDEEDIIYLKDKGIQIQEGNQIIGKYKVPCYKFYNLNETEVFDELDSNQLYEATGDSERNSYASRVVSILFLRIRQVATMKDKEQKIAASCALLASINSLAAINVSYARRFLPLVRNL